MCRVAIVGGGPLASIPALQSYNEIVDIWIGADEGAIHIINEGISLHTAIGDFDSITEEDLERLYSETSNVQVYPEEKDKTDLELAVLEAIKLQPTSILFFGVTGGRIDHTLTNVQLLYLLIKKDIKATIIDTLNVIELYQAGEYTIMNDRAYPYVSFIPMSESVHGLTLHGFYYSIKNKSIHWGSTLCLSNKLLLKKGTFSFDDGILILIKSRDQMTQPIY